MDPRFWHGQCRAGVRRPRPVIDGFTELMVDLFGEDAALCPRAVAGMAELALDSPVIVEGEVEIREVT